MSDSRDLVATLIHRSRAARIHLNLHVADRALREEHPEHWHALTLHLTAAWDEAHRAAELARRILYRDDQQRLGVILARLIAADRAAHTGEPTREKWDELDAARAQFTAFLRYANEL